MIHDSAVQDQEARHNWQLRSQVVVTLSRTVSQAPRDSANGQNQTLDDFVVDMQGGNRVRGQRSSDVDVA